MFWSEIVVNLDLVLVPTGILLLVAYHVYLLNRIIKAPDTTVIGFENANRKVWAQQMMQGVPKNTSLALQVVSNNMSTAVYLASLSLAISSLVGTIVSYATASTSSASSNGLGNEIFFGSRSSSTSQVKHGSLLLCFLVAFMAFVQCVRYYIHLSFLMSSPNQNVHEDYIEKAVIRASHFWSLGIRAYYFAFPLLLWITGPIAMFVCSLGMISFLYFLDFTADSVSAFAIKSSSKRCRDTTLDIGGGIQSSGG